MTTPLLPSENLWLAGVQRLSWSKCAGLQRPMRPPAALEARPFARGCTLDTREEPTLLVADNSIAAALRCVSKVAYMLYHSLPMN